ncbi:MAG: hypothetical protein AB8E15_03230 [Bdellovibrionales bacterium]
MRSSNAPYRLPVVFSEHFIAKMVMIFVIFISSGALGEEPSKPKYKTIKKIVLSNPVITEPVMESGFVVPVQENKLNGDPNPSSVIGMLLERIRTGLYSQYNNHLTAWEIEILFFILKNKKNLKVVDLYLSQLSAEKLSSKSITQLFAIEKVFGLLHFQRTIGNSAVIEAINKLEFLEAMKTAIDRSLHQFGKELIDESRQVFKIQSEKILFKPEYDLSRFRSMQTMDSWIASSSKEFRNLFWNRIENLQHSAEERVGSIAIRETFQRLGVEMTGHISRIILLSVYAKIFVPEIMTLFFGENPNYYKLAVMPLAAWMIKKIGKYIEHKIEKPLTDKISFRANRQSELLKSDYYYLEKALNSCKKQY